MKEPKGTVRNIQDRTETGQTTSLSNQIKAAGLSEKHQKPNTAPLTKSQNATRLPKDSTGHWRKRLKKRSYADRAGRRVEVPEWQARVFFGGREAWFNTGTANRDDAAVLARDFFVFLKANGWEAARAKFKQGSEGESVGRNTTVGSFLDAVQVTGLLRLRTFLNYGNCLRTIVSEVFKVKAGPAKYDYRSGGAGKWRQRIDSITLAKISPDRIEKWKRERIAKAGNSPVAIAAAKRTVNSYIRCARSLFSGQILKKLKKVELPATLPFDGVELEDAGSVKYVSKVNAQALIAAARAELKSAEPEVYKAFLLGLFAGMRKAEIDLCEWRMVDFNANVIRLEQTEWLHLKTQDSAAEITVDAELIAELRELRPAGKSAFLLASTHPPRNDSARAYYRCQPVFDRLNEWLRSKGVTANKPLHEMRKEIGALVATQHGIYAASRFLRHTDITTTARHYAQHKDRISVGLGKLLDTEIQPTKKTA